MSTEGYNNLLRAIQEEIEDKTNRPPILDFGEITGEKGLVMNFFPLAIPPDGYLVSHRAASGDEKIKPGDRVLVAWVGDDPVVIDRFQAAADYWNQEKAD